jgi:hypothetical protein
MSAAAGRHCISISLFVQFISDLLSGFLPAVGETHRHEHRSMDLLFLSRWNYRENMFDCKGKFFDGLSFFLCPAGIPM